MFHFSRYFIYKKKILKCIALVLLQTCFTYSQTPTFNTDNVLDIREFPKGYFLGTNNYQKCNNSINQLRSYPVPRFMPGVSMHRNVNWVKCMWMADILNQNELQPVHSYKIKEAVAIQNELAENWNYYYSFSENVSRGWNKLKNKSTMVNAAYIDDINTSGKNYLLACLTYRRQMDVTAVKSRNHDYSSCENILSTKGEQRSMIICQKLESSQPSAPCTYPEGSVYPRDESGKKITPGSSSPNSWSPLAVNRKVYLGDATALEAALDKYLNTGDYHLSESAKKRIAMISENNEVAPKYGTGTDGNNRLEADKKILKEAQKAPYLGNMELYQAEAKKNIDNDYRDYVLNSKLLGLPSSTNFLNYSVHGFSDFQHVYKELRLTQKPIGGNHYPTSDFYINQPDYWNVLSKGASHGWQWVAVSRYREIYDDGNGKAFNDNWFAPYISAGYNTNMELNTRPGQYLGFLKALMLQGAEFFHPFVQNNIQQGNAFCWQVAIPVYAQALGSRLYHFLQYGKSLFGDLPLNVRRTGKDVPSFRFDSGNNNHLITVRQDADDKTHTLINRFAIAGAIMKSSNGINDSPLRENATITLNKQQLTFPISRQGNTYVYDYTDKNNIIFYQLDKWHQYEHPDYWSKDFEFEAEVNDNKIPGDWKIKSEGIVASSSKVDLTNVTSYIQFISMPSSPLTYTFQPRKDDVQNDYSLWIKARSARNSSIDILMRGNNNQVTHQLENINSGKWIWYEVTPGKSTYSGLSDDDIRYELQLMPGNANVEIDAIKLVAGKK